MATIGLMAASQGVGKVTEFAKEHKKAIAIAAVIGVIIFIVIIIAVIFLIRSIFSKKERYERGVSYRHSPRDMMKKRMYLDYNPLE